MNRRTFLQSTVLAAGWTAGAGCSTLKTMAAPATKGVTWPIGCFNRPWTADKTWGYDVALDGIKAAGYKLTGLLSRLPQEPLTGSDATREYLTELKKRIATRGLAVNMSALRTKDNLPLAEQIKDMRTQIDNSKFVGAQFLLTFGVSKPEHFETYYQLMHDASDYAAQLGMQVVLKPHGGASGAAEEIARCMEKVAHPNFKIWFDAGNIIFYTGKDPLAELKPIVQHVTGFCAKDCGEQKGSVMLEFGKGKVDFKAVFTELKRANFNGPVMVECCEVASTPEAVTASARKNREYLERVFASL